MGLTHPEDYHEYVFRDGKLVGDFDNMYRYAKGVPWDQDQRSQHWYAEAGIVMAAARAPYARILDIGCGLGYITAKLAKLAMPGGIVEAFDVSPEAIRKATALHPGISFFTDDITSTSFQPRRPYDLVAVRDIFWYVLDDLQTVVTNIERAVAPGGTLYLSQTFPDLDRPYVGKHVIPGPDALTALFGGFRPVYSARLRNHEMANDGPILHVLSVKDAPAG